MGVRLTKISHIRNLRNFIDFNSSHELKRHEVFYAPNGSGKTNLTRILVALQNGEALDRFKSKEAKPGDVPEFSISFDSLAITQANYTDTSNAEVLSSMMIFNSDFIASNVTVPDFKKDLDGDVVLELGKEDTDIKELERKIAKERVTINGCVERLEKSITAFIGTLKGKTYKANEQNIWSELKLDKVLSIPATDKSASSVNEDGRASITDADYSKTAQERTDLLALEGADKLSLVFPNVSKPATDDIINALASTETFPSDDKEISNNVKFLSALLQDHLAFDKEPHDVIDTAITKSEEKDKCVLCKRALDDPTRDLFSRYHDFFAGKKAKFEENLRKYVQEVESLTNTIESIPTDKKERINQLAELFGVKERWVDIDTSKLLSSLKRLKTELEAKQSDLSTPMQSQDADKIDAHLDDLITTLSSNKKLADALDIKSNDVAANLANVRRKIGQMELSNFIAQNATEFGNITTSNDNVATLSAELKTKQGQAPKKSIRKNTSELSSSHFSGHRVSPWRR